MTVGLARKVATEGIRVNAVRPGVIDTDIHASGGDPDRAGRFGPGIPLGRAGSADEVAPVARLGRVVLLHRLPGGRLWQPLARRPFRPPIRLAHDTRERARRLPECGLRVRAEPEDQPPRPRGSPPCRARAGARRRREPRAPARGQPIWERHVRSQLAVSA
ncbi:SDR family oxidoreductase [Sorangium sp. So ce429]